jgi:hypothetical protein
LGVRAALLKDFCIEKTLTSNPLKLYLDVEKDFETICEKGQDLLWPENLDEARRSDIVDRYAEQAGMPWLPPKGLNTLSILSPPRRCWEYVEAGVCLGWLVDLKNRTVTVYRQDVGQLRH